MFPKDFLWGAATAAYQVEGYNQNTDWAMAAKEGRVPAAGRLCDHYHLYEKDFDLMKELGHNAHRLSVEWARIEPREGEFDEDELEHYRQVLRALKRRGITPSVTLWHFSLPLWFSERGGFSASDAPQLFARYCARVVAALQADCQQFATINEPNVYGSQGYLRGTWPPFKRFALTDLVSITNSNRTYEAKARRGLAPLFVYLRVMRNLARAHNAAYRAAKEQAPEVSVGLVKHIIFFAANTNPLNQLRAWLSNYFWTQVFMQRTYQRCDFIGLNYYIHVKYGDRASYDKTDIGWDVYPEGVLGALRLLARYKKPLYVTEAGLADKEDRLRADYITTQVAAVAAAYKEGIDVRGHFYWSFMDNYEWALGTEMRFGLVAVDYTTLERTVRPSAFVYRDIIAANGNVPAVAAAVKRLAYD